MFKLNELYTTLHMSNVLPIRGFVHITYTFWMGGWVAKYSTQPYRVGSSSTYILHTHRVYLNDSPYGKIITPFRYLLEVIEQETKLAYLQT